MLGKDKKDLIIVPCDFTEESRNALAHASKIARQHEDEVRLLHIINSETKSKLKKAHAGEETVYEELKRWADENHRMTGVNTSYHAEEGSIFSTIGEYITDTEAGLVVMGTHGVRGIQHIVGAFAMRVIGSSPVPVIVVQKKGVSAEGIKRIVLPIDHNKHGKNKTAYAIAIAKYFDGEVHVFESLETDEYIASQVKLNTQHAVQYLERNNVRHVMQHENPHEGSFIRQLLRYASQINADLIVISSHQDTHGVADLLLGNNEGAIVNNDGQIPVMCVNPVQDTAHLGVFG